MENTRTCKRCGFQSVREEQLTNLSLDLIPGGSVEKMLENYLKENEVEYKCPCGGKVSGISPAFATLPKFLILHLKRFRLTDYGPEKMDEPVQLQRDLVMSSKLGGGCYSLVSTISHIGNTDRGKKITCLQIRDELITVNRPNKYRSS
ncbi:ubiquitin carboxyl-terminal hydrolase 37-like [Cololabis saira]|uniref:ubiquitin carboxyl-terminal hydrolase 37-like n=1 Tax=Cololabis saira TaxID=129043 RepID=UPI002AD3BB49|nr:ubiquitin carboxyl-terminal hydrolase 37-like [Cololabis saira]